MSNPFQKEFKDDPEVQKRQAAFQNQQLVEAQKRNTESEITRLDPMVVEVLEQLRATFYPTFVLKKGQMDPEHHQPIDHNNWWSLCYYYERSVGGNKTAYRQLRCIGRKVTVGFYQGSDGSVQGFVGRYYRSEVFPSDKIQPNCRELRSAFNRDALIQMLIDLHKPSARAELVLAHDDTIFAVLVRLSDLQLPFITDEKLVWERPKWIDKLGNDGRIDPDEILRTSMIGDWCLSVRIPGSYSDPEYFSPRIIVRLQLDENGEAIQYKYEIAETAGVAPLDGDALFVALERRCRELSQKKHETEANVQVKPKKKSWFGR